MQKHAIGESCEFQWHWDIFSLYAYKFKQSYLEMIELNLHMELSRMNQSQKQDNKKSKECRKVMNEVRDIETHLNRWYQS